MSLYPCLTDGKRIIGPPSTIYANLMGGSYLARKKLHFCAAHIQSELVARTSQLQLCAIGDNTLVDLEQLDQDCQICGSYGAYTLRVDSYVKGDEPRAWRAKLCDQHVDEVAQKLGVSL